MGTSGPNIPESQRHTERINVRLAPEVAAQLRALAKSRGLTVAEMVTELVKRATKKGARDA